MVRLVPLRPLSTHGRSSELWINPEHIVSIQPIRSETGTQVSLDVEVKLVGLNLMRARIGSYADTASADDAWQALLTSLAAPGA